MPESSDLRDAAEIARQCLSQVIAVALKSLSVTNAWQCVFRDASGVSVNTVIRDVMSRSAFSVSSCTIPGMIYLQAGSNGPGLFTSTASIISPPRNRFSVSISERAASLPADQTHCANGSPAFLGLVGQNALSPGLSPIGELAARG